MKYVFFLIIPFLLMSAGCNRVNEPVITSDGLHSYVQQPIVNMMASPTEDTDAISQVIYGMEVFILEEFNQFYRVDSEDECIGWVDKNTIATTDRIQNSRYPIKSLFAHIYLKDDISTYPPIMTLPFGAEVEALEELGEEWVRIELVDGRQAFIQRGDIDFSPKPLSLKEMLELSTKFLELPYTWAGTSSFGFDCSGFVQMLYKQMGVLLPRGSRSQVKSLLLEPANEKNLLPGDLLYFGDSRINHVALYLGNDKYIHSTVGKGGPKIVIGDLNTTELIFICAKRLKSNKP